jgi:hypothetical protein
MQEAEFHMFGASHFAAKAERRIKKFLFFDPLKSRFAEALETTGPSARFPNATAYHFNAVVDRESLDDRVQLVGAFDAARASYDCWKVAER